MKKNIIGIVIMLVAAVFTAIGQFHWKIGLGFVDEIFDVFKSSENFWKVIPYILVGFVLYGCGSALMIVAYKYGDVSMLHPLLGVSYILSLIIGFSLLGESINVQKVIAVIVIITGLVFLGWSAYDIEKRKSGTGAVALESAAGGTDTAQPDANVSQDTEVANEEDTKC